MKIKYRNSEDFHQIDGYQFINTERIRLIGTSIPISTVGFDIYADDGTQLYLNGEHTILYEQTDEYIEYTTNKDIHNVFCLYNPETLFITGQLSSINTEIENGIFIKSGQGKEFQNPSEIYEYFDENGFYNYKIDSVENLNIIKVTAAEKNIMRIEKEKEESELKKMTFEENKEDKIYKSKMLLSLYLESHPLVSNCHGNIEAEYNVTTEKQNLMTGHYATYTIEKNLGLNPVLKWNSTDAECEVWTEEEFIQLILEIKSYVEPLVSLQQSYEVAIKNCTTQEELDAIDIVYDVYGIAE